MAYVVGPKGQVVIAKEIRDRLGIGPGWIAVQRVAGGHVEMRFLPPDHRESLKGSLAPYVRAGSRDQDWGQLRDQAWRETAETRERETPESR